MSTEIKTGDKVKFTSYTGASDQEYTVLAVYHNKLIAGSQPYLFLDAPVNGRPVSIVASRVVKVEPKFVVGKKYTRNGISFEVVWANDVNAVLIYRSFGVTGSQVVYHANVANYTEAK